MSLAPMESPNELFSTSDKFLIGGIGCGLVGLCLFLGAIVFISESSAQTLPTAAPVGSSDSPTQTPTSFVPALGIPTEIFLPTLETTFPTEAIPSPVPSFRDGPPPAGKIVFACYIEQIDQICLMDADGTGREQVTDLPATAFYPSLSLDGETIYFVSKQSGGFEVYSVNVNGNGLKRLTDGIGSLYAPELSPDGERIVFTNNRNGLWVMKPDGKNPHPLTDRDDIDPTWSPDGSMIAFASSRAGARQLFVMNSDGSNVRKVTDLNNMGGRSTWSPDGTRLAFYRGPAGDHNIYVVNVDGTGLVKLTDGGDNLAPSWSPDGNWIAFTSFRDRNNEIYIMHPDGTGVIRLTNNSISDWQPRWGR